MSSHDTSHEDSVLQIEERYKVPAPSSINHILEKDSADDSLARYKKSLLGEATSILIDPNDKRNVIPESITLMINDHEDINFDLKSKDLFTNKTTVRLKEASIFRMRIKFYIQRDLVTGLKYKQNLYKGPLKVDSTTYMIGSRAPKQFLQEYVGNEEELPSGSEDIAELIENIINPKSKNIDLQLGALLMAIYHKELSIRSTARLTKAMCFSGYTFHESKRPTDFYVDKHSTGGVGDKISIPLVPILLACNLKVPMISGRSLGHTGGTLDKLESIVGFSAHSSKEHLVEVLREFGGFIVEQTTELVPADRILYFARDNTETVNNNGLIAASILSKKAAEALDFLLMDVKVGEGGFMKNISDAKKLSSLLIHIGKEMNLNIEVVLTKMDYPIGRGVGNAIEIIESIELLKNRLNNSSHLYQLTTLYATIFLQKIYKLSKEESLEKIKVVIENGAAYRKFKKMISLFGVKEETINELDSIQFPWDKKIFPICHLGKKRFSILNVVDGYVNGINSLSIGKCLTKLRVKYPKNTFDIYLEKILNEKVKENDVLAYFYYDKCQDIDIVERTIRESFVIGTERIYGNYNYFIEQISD
ncbi:hypothetical protein SNEBB_002774 [Seison nebaliae]|nr:hypothetical protein SNEBB_002774 [Seison nebaliae]